MNLQVLPAGLLALRAPMLKGLATQQMRVQDLGFQGLGLSGLGFQGLGFRAQQLGLWAGYPDAGARKSLLTCTPPFPNLTLQAQRWGVRIRSWVAISRVISRVTVAITHIRGLLTPLKTYNYP